MLQGNVVLNQMPDRHEGFDPSLRLPAQLSAAKGNC